MKLIHFTPRRFQYFTADSIYISNLATAFSAILGDDYLLVLAGKNDDQLKSIKTVNLRIFAWKDNHLLYFWLPIIIYFFWTPYFVLKRKLSSSDTCFFASDPNMLSILIFWRKILRFKFKICSDWHMLYNNWKDRFIIFNSDKLVTTSEKLKKEIIARNGIDKEKILSVYGGVDINKFGPVDKLKARKVLNLPLGKKLVGYVGLFKTMGMEKGIATMIKALPSLSDEFVMVFIGGKENEIKDYQEFADGLGVAERCLFEKRKNFEEVALYEQAMDILAIPYPDQPHFRNYGFPMKVYEYMAARRPIIYSRLELTEEVLADCGFTFAPDDSEDLARTIKYVFDNKEEVEKGVEIAYSKLKDLTWGKKAEKIINFLDYA